jgi:hypothetical protein
VQVSNITDVPIDFSASVGEVTTPIALQAGWYDLFRTGSFRTISACGPLDGSRIC